MMKRKIKLLIAVVLLFCSIILIDRHKHIEHDYDHEGISYITITDGIFVNVPHGKWLDLSDDMNVSWTNMFVDKYNYLLCTWKNNYSMATQWVYYDYGGQPFLLSVVENDMNFNKKILTPVEYTYYGEIEGLKIHYGYLNNSIYVKIESKTKIIEINLYKEHKEVLERVVLKAIDVLKD